jgi:hypothetical protein
VRFQVEKTKFEHGKKADGAGSDDDDIGFDGRAHELFHSLLVYEAGNWRSSYVKMGPPTTLSR